MSQSAGIDLDLNAQSYLQTSAQVVQQNSLMDGSFSRLAISTALVDKTLGNASFGKKHGAELGTFAATAAVAQQQMASFAATAAVTGQSTNKLGVGIRQLAREFPGGTNQALQTVSAITQLGVSAKGTEGNVISLSKTMMQLQQSTGGSSTDFAAGMIQLERTFGDKGIDPKKVAATADSLVQVSKATGASATGTLAFANAIGPTTQSAGISKAATLGIGAAFSSIGQDGTSAATAINKMLSDMSKAVRDGGPEMSAYADIVGTTADNFKKMFQNNPTAAIEQVTNAIGKAGNAGPRLLDNLGLDGVRTQRALQALTQSGGLTNAINTSVGAQGNGVNAKASAASMDTVLDKFTEFGTSMSQIAQAFGKPLLYPLGILATVAASVAKTFATIADSGIGKVIIETVAAFLILRRGFGLGLTGALVKQGVTSGPVGAGLAGYRAGRGIPATQGVLGGTAGGMQTLEEQGLMRTGAMGGVRGRIYDFSRGMGESELARSGPAPAPGTGPGFIGRMAQGARTTVGLGANAYMRANAASFAAANAPAGPERDAAVSRAFGPSLRGLASSGGTLARGVVAGANPLNTQKLGDSLSRTSPAMDDFRTRLTASGKGVSASLGVMAKDSGSFFARILAKGGLAAGGTAVAGVKGLGGLVSGMLPGLAITGAIAGGMALWNKSQSPGRKTAAENSREDSMTATDNIDAYNSSIGRAATSTGTFADAVAQHSKLVNTAVTSLSQALSVSDADKQSAVSTTKNTVNYDPSASNSQLSAQLRQTSVGGMDPQQIQQVKLDLIRQFGSQRAGQVLESSGIQDSQITSTGAPDFVKLTQEASDKTINNSEIGKPNKVTAASYYQLGSSLNKAGIRTDAKNINDTIAQSMQQRFSAQQDSYGTGYATQTRAVDINQVAAQAARSGNEAEFNSVTDELTRTQLGLKKIPRITSTEVNKAQQQGGSYLTVLASKSKDFAKTLQEWQSEGIDVSGKGGLPQTTTLSATAARFQASNLGANANANGTNNAAGVFFDNTVTKNQAGQLANQNTVRAGGVFNQPVSAATFQANQAMLASIASPDDTQKQSTAQNEVVSATISTGGSLTKLNEQLGKVASSIDDDTNPAFQRMLGVMAQIRQQAQVNAQYQSSGTSLGTQLQLDSKDANVKGTSQGATNTRQAGVAGATQDVANFNSMVKAELAAQRSYQIQSTRATEDFQLQNKQADQDYYISATTGAQDYYISAVRAEQDYETQVQRSQRDFAITMARGEDDFNTQRLRSVRDFNKQIAREVSDSAAQLYDPYKRIQTEMVWDAQSLIANMKEQNTAIAKQNADLAKVKAMGLSTGAVQQLGLNQSTNAQQLSEIVGDAMTDPSLIKQLNSTSAATQTLGTVLVSDPTNKDIQRAKDDFQTQLSDQEKDYTKSVARSKADFAKQAADTEADYNKSTGRMDKDYQLSTERAYKNFELQLARQAQSYSTMMTRAKQDLVESQQEITLTIAQTWGAAMDLIQGKMTATNGLMHNGLKDLITQNGALLQTTATQLSNGTLTLSYSSATKAPTPASVATETSGIGLQNQDFSQGAGGHKPAFGDGSIFNSPRVVIVGERTPEAIIPLSGQGVSILAQAFERAHITSQQGANMTTSSTGQPVQYVSSSHLIDQSSNFAGANFEVKSNDPMDMARKIAAQTRAANLAPSGKKP